MEIKEYRYDAFISYRHLPADIAAADKLQKLLERHKKKNGKNLRIFRDRTELPTSPDLGNQIEEALRESRYLILICSPAYLESKWCMQELAYFRHLHGDRNVNILPLLLEGEPDDVFPDEICHDLRLVTDENGTEHTVSVEIEPLGADIRAETIQEQHKKLRTEYLRIAAPLLDVSFDALYQRTKRRQMMTVGIIAGVIVLIATIFAFYNLHMLRRIDEEHQSMLARESLRLATESQDALKTGDTNLAMLLAMEALPADLDDPERPLVEEAEVALRSAVYTRMAQEQSSPLQRIASIDFNVGGSELLGVFQKGRTFAVTDQEFIYFYDSATGALLFSCPGRSYDAFILNDGALLVVMDTETFGGTDFKAAVYDVTAGERVYERAFSLEDAGLGLLLSPESDVLYFVASRWDNDGKQITETLLEAVNPDGTPAAEQILPPRDLLENVQDVKYRNSKENAEDYLDTTADYNLWDGFEKRPHPTTVQGETYQALIESQWKDGFRDAMITQDEELLIYEPAWDRHILYSIAMMEQGSCEPVEVTGDISVDSVNKRLYSSTGSSFQVYSYDAGNFYGGESAELVSTDGSRCAVGTVIYDAADLSNPLLEVSAANLSYRYGKRAGYHMTPDLEYVFAHTSAEVFQLWSVSDGLVMELIPDQNMEKKAVALAVSADGTLVALAHDDHSVEVYTNTAEFVTSFAFTEDINYVEFEENKLLISGDGLSWIVDVYGQEPTVEINDGCCSSDYDFVDQFLTFDGLLLCAGEYFEGSLDAIYDIETGECIFEERGYYQYDEQSGILLYIPADPRFMNNPVLHAAKRDENGVVQDIYTVKPEGVDLCLPRIPHGTDGAHFMLVNDTCCQVYSITTGKPVLTVYFPNEQNRWELQYCLLVRNNALYDLRFYGNTRTAAYPIGDLATLLEYAKEYLTSDCGTRELSDAEKAKYFIEN